MAENEATAESEKEFRSSFRMRRILVPILLGLIAAGWLLWRELSKVRFESVPAGTGEYEWIGSGPSKIPNLEDPDQFRIVQDGKGDYRLMTATQILRTIDWTWYSTMWMIMAVISTAFRDL